MRQAKAHRRPSTDHARFTRINQVQVLDHPGEPAKDEVWR